MSKIVFKEGAEIGSSRYSRLGDLDERTLGGVVRSRIDERGNRFLKLLGALAVGPEIISGVAGEARRRELGLTPRPYGQAALRGIEEHSSFRDVVKSYEELDNKFGTVLGTAGDILIDPMNLFPAGRVADLGASGIAATAKILRRSPQMSRLMDAVGDKVVTEYMIKSRGFGDFLPIKRQLLGRLNQIKTQKLDEVEKGIIELLPNAKAREKVGVLVADQPFSASDPYFPTWKQQVSELNDVEREAFKLGAKGWKDLQDIKIGSGMLDAERAQGFLESFGRKRHVALRTANKESTLKFIDQEYQRLSDMLGPKRAANLTENQALQVERDMGGLRQWRSEIEAGPDVLRTHVKEIDRFYASGQVPSFLRQRRTTERFGDMNEETYAMFEKDIAKMLNIERRDVRKAAVNQLFLKEASDYLVERGMLVPRALSKGGKLRTLDEGADIVANEMKLTHIDPKRTSGELVGLNVKELDGFLAPKEIAEEINRVARAYSTEETIKETMSVWRELTSVWKAVTLSIFPSYHSRNFLSNLWNNSLAGMGLDSIQDYKAAAHFLTRAKKGRFTGEKIFGMTDKELYDKMLLGRVIDGGQYSEVSEIFSKTHLSLMPKWMDPREWKAVELGYKGGRAIEDNARAAHFMWALRKGKSAEDAALSVHKFLFDYQYGLTKLEGKIFRDRLIPFYAWTRFNVPLQLEMIIRRPTRFTAGLKTLAGVEDEFGGADPNEVYMAEWMREATTLRFKTGKDNAYQYFMLDSWWPAADIGKVMSGSRAFQELLNMTTPFIKVWGEVASNYNLYQRRKIKEFEGQKKDVLGVGLPAKLEHFVRSARAINELDRTIQSYHSGSTPVRGAVLSMTRLLIGKAYPQDFDAQKRRWDYATREGLGELKSLKRREEKMGRMGNVRQLDKDIEELEKLRAEHLGVAPARKPTKRRKRSRPRKRP